MISFDIESFRASMAAGVEKVAAFVGEEELREIGFAGAEVFRDEAKRNAAPHVKSGLLFGSIIVVRLAEESDSNVRQAYKVTVRSGQGGAYYWRWVERGHKFVPRNKKVSAKTGRKIGWKAHRKAAELEYGTATAVAHPFMRPAFESKKQASVDMMSEKLVEMIKRNQGGT